MKHLHSIEMQITKLVVAQCPRDTKDIRGTSLCEHLKKKKKNPGKIIY